MGPTDYDAIVLAGGRSSRAGTDKLLLHRDGRSLLSYALDAVADAHRIVAVGTAPQDDRGRARWRREDPPFAGPVAAIGAALADLDCATTVVLAGDLPEASPAVRAVLESMAEGIDAAVVVDRSGVRQPLLAAYRTEWLRSRVPVASAAARSLLDGARTVEVIDRWGAADDLDSPADAVRLGFHPVSQDLPGDPTR